MFTKFLCWAHVRGDMDLCVHFEKPAFIVLCLLYICNLVFQINIFQFNSIQLRLSCNGEKLCLEIHFHVVIRISTEIEFTCHRCHFSNKISSNFVDNGKTDRQKSTLTKPNILGGCNEIQQLYTSLNLTSTACNIHKVHLSVTLRCCVNFCRIGNI